MNVPNAGPERFTVNDIPIRDIDDANLPKAIALMKREIEKIAATLEQTRQLRDGAVGVLCALEYELDRRAKTISLSREIPPYKGLKQ